LLEGSFVTPRKPIVCMAGVAGSLLAVWLLAWAVAILFGVRLLPAALLPQGQRETPPASPEMIIATGVEAGQPWTLAVHTLGEKSCVQTRIGGEAGAGQCGYRAVPQDARYSASTAEFPRTGRYLVFGPVPQPTTKVVVRFPDGAENEVPAIERADVRVKFFYLVTSRPEYPTSLDIRLLDAQGREVPV
jgi:hypothetical protein